MAVTYDTSASASTTTNGATSITVAITPAAQADAAILAFGGIGTGSGHNDAGYLLSAQYDGSTSGVSCAKVHSNNSNVGFIEAFWVPLGTGPGVSKNVVLSCATALAAGTDALACHVIAVYGVDQANPTAVTSFGSATPTRQVTSAVGDLAVFAFGSGASIAGATQTQRTIQNVNTFSACGNTETQTAAGAASVTAAYTDNADWWSAIGVNLAAAAGAADATATPGAIVVVGSIPQASAVNLGGPVMLRGPITSGVRLA